MSIIFKIKHYLIPYFQETFYSSSYVVKPNADLHPIYWISGYEKNIFNKKWKFENGIPLGIYNNSWKANIEKRTHISALAEYFFALDPVRNKTQRQLIVDFIINNLKEEVSKEGFRYCYWPTYLSENSQDYFVHGMGQGQILSVLTRARIETNNSRLDDSIRKVGNSFKLQFGEKNGFVDRSDGIILQEYPHLKTQNDAVLNGWVLSIIGLYDYIKAGFADPIINQIFNESILTLKDKLPEYNIGYWTLYNLPSSYKNIASAHYHGQHIVFLKVLGILLNDDEIRVFSDNIRLKTNNLMFRIFALLVKIVANLFKYKRLYKT
tara:strand:- start:12333 stop:13298 length:966 start_codon:yes stop_codon:yes gene_type:complete